MRLLLHRESFPITIPCHRRRLGIRVWTLVVMFTLLAMRAGAAVHPVPLDKNTDSAKCLECHEGKNKGKSVHFAIAAGCTSCHEIRVNKDVTRVKLITATLSALCFTCHADKKAVDIKGTVHFLRFVIVSLATIFTPATTNSSSSNLHLAMRKRISAA